MSDRLQEAQQAPSATDLADLYHAAATMTSPPADWPPPALVAWAHAVLPALVSSNEAAWTTMQWTRWPGLCDPNGQLHEGTWDVLGWWLVETKALRVANKKQVPVWAPGRFEGNRRADAATQALFALVLDCDDHGDWTTLLPTLDSVGLAYVAHRSPSHGQANDAGRQVIKWRLVLPLVLPVTGAELAHWRASYTAARIVFGALGNCWFDHTTHNTSRLWFAASAVGDGSEREIVYPIAGRTLRVGNLLARAPVWRPAAAKTAAPRIAGRPGDPLVRGQRYLAKIGPAAVGSRNATAYRGAKWLVSDLGLAEADALSLLEQWNGGNAEPLPDGELRACLASANRSGARGSVRAV